jgi:phosphoribosyl-AMP cyclohydrolase
MRGNKNIIRQSVNPNKPGEKQKEELTAAQISANVRQGIISNTGSEGNKDTYGNYNPNVQTVRRESGTDVTSGKPISAKNTYEIPGLPGYKASITQNEGTTVSNMGQTNGEQPIQSQFSNRGDADKTPNTYQGQSRTETSNFKPLNVGENRGEQVRYVDVQDVDGGQIKTLRNVKTNKPVGSNNGVISSSVTGYKNNTAIRRQAADSTASSFSRQRTQLWNEIGGKMKYLSEDPDRKL